MNFNIAIVGATGNVGREMLNILSEKKYDASKIFPVASGRSEGMEIEFVGSRKESYSYQSRNPKIFSGTLEKSE